MKTIEEIADDIINHSKGSFSIARTDEYEALSKLDQSKVDDLVGEEIQPCGSCGWYWHNDSMERSIEFDEEVCPSCADNERDAAEEEEEGWCGNCGGLHYVHELNREGHCEECDEALEDEDE